MESNPVIQLFLALGIIVAAAKIAGAASRKVGQPRVLGELLAGIVLGPSLLNFLHWPLFTDSHVGETVHQLAELGVLLLMFKVGMEVHLRELVAVGRVGILAGTVGALAPVALAAPLVLAFGYSSEAGLFAGVALAATSVSISAQTMLELRVLRTKEGNALLAAALVDDVLAILLISLVVALTGPQGSIPQGELLAIILRMAGFIGGALAVSWFVLPRILNWLHDQHHMAHGGAAFGLIFALTFGWSAEALGGVAAITGAFIAGVGISRARESVRREIETAVTSIGYALLVPVFFVSVGLVTDLHLIGLDVLPFAAILLLAAVVSKVGGCGLGARMAGFDNTSSLRVGIAMISRGEVGLIIVSIGLASGYLSGPLFPALFLVILLSTVLTPPLVRWAFQPVPERTMEHELAPATIQPEPSMD